MIDINKQYQTRDGREVKLYEIVSRAYPDTHPVMGLVKNRSGYWCLRQWTLEGFYDYRKEVESLCDLIEVKPRIQREYWVNIYDMGAPAWWPTPEKAAEYRAKYCIACVKVVIDVEEGEGL